MDGPVGMGSQQHHTPASALAQVKVWRSELARVEDLESVIDLINKSSAVWAWLRRKKDYRNAIREISAFNLEAQRRAGQMLEKILPHQGGRPKENGSKMEPFGITKQDSHRWQRIASVPDEKWEDFISGPHLTQTAALQLASSSNEPDCNERTWLHSTLDELIGAGARFGTIYADPPWPYANQGTRASTGNHYACMSLDDIKAMPVQEVASDPSHLHLWTTNAFLREAFDVIEAWGFTYKSCAVWCKPQMGIGNYWRVSHEFLLLGVRGSLTFAGDRPKSWTVSDRFEHSHKPNVFRQMIEKVSPGPRLEMFAREQHEGWTAHGSHVEQTLFSVATSDHGDSREKEVSSNAYESD